MRSRVRILVAVMVALMLGTVVMPGVLAQDYDTKRGRVINLEADPAFPATDTVNIADLGADASKIQLEKDALRAEFNEPGRYVGPYIRSSNFEFTYQKGGMFSFQSTFNFTREQIMSGVSNYWVRWPVDVSEYDVYCIWMKNYFANDTDWTPDYYAEKDYVRCEGTNPDIMTGFIGMSTTTLSLGKFAFRDSTGLYTREWGWLLPGRDYSFYFEGHLNNETNPSVWLSAERFQVETNTTFVFSDYIRGESHSENLSVYPAFAFNMLGGIGEGGLTAYRIPFDGTNETYISAHVVPYTGNYSSIYIPFAGADNVTWTIQVNYSYIIFVNFTPVLFVAMQEWTINDTKNFLLTSSPSNFTGSYRLSIKADKPVTLLGFVPDSVVKLRVNYTFNADNGVPWGDNSVATGWGLPFIPFIDVQHTEGRWAEVTPGPYFQSYNFGWGRAYLFPGQTRLVMFLKDGQIIPFDSEILDIADPVVKNQCEALVESVFAGIPFLADWVGRFACFVGSLIGDIVGFIQMVFQQIWNFLKQLGEWIYNAILSFIDLVVKIVTGIVDAASAILTTLLMAMPFVLVLFVMARGMPDVMESFAAGRATMERAAQIRARIWRRAR